MVTTALATKRELNGERKHAMNLKPLGDRIIVKQDEAQETTAGGLYIAAESKEKPQSGVVLAVGEGKVTKASTFPCLLRLATMFCTASTAEPKLTLKAKRF